MGCRQENARMRERAGACAPGPSRHTHFREAQIAEAEIRIPSPLRAIQCGAPSRPDASGADAAARAEEDAPASNEDSVCAQCRVRQAYPLRRAQKPLPPWATRRARPWDRPGQELRIGTHSAQAAITL